MLKHVTIPQDRAWNSWSDRPAELVFLPLGVRVTPVLYSSRLRKTSLILPRHDVVRLGRHGLDGAVIELETDLAGTTVAFAALKPDPFVVRGSWAAVKTAEWGLRFWVTVALSAEGGESPSYDPATGIALLKIGARFVALATADPPVQVTGHATLTDLQQDFEANGYFHIDSRSLCAPVLALRFNLEMMRQGTYAAAVADSAALAMARARAALAPQPACEMPTHTGHSHGALDAIRDIVGWNTIWDVPNARPCTAVTRIWNLGSFAVWFNDQTYAALLAGLFDTAMARENMAVALAGATPQGNIACIVTSKDQWVDRSQPPLAALVVWHLYLRTGERSILEQSYPTLVRNHRWWWQNRDAGGLISCGTSDVGEGLYQGTAFAARNETGMDNSATHDEAVYDPENRRLSTWDLGLNCAVALDGEMLGKMAQALGQRDAAAEFAARATRTRALIGERLWDADRNLFANRQRDGGFVRSVSPTSFYPLLCGAASGHQTRHLLRHLHDPATFGGDWGLPNATRDDPAFADNTYWRGRIWPNVNYLVWLGLRRNGLLAEASHLAAQSLALFEKSWTTDRIAAENYSATTGEAMDQGDTDPFYIWAGLLPLMAVAEIVDFDPWRGLTLCNGGQDVALGSITSPHGRLALTISGGILTVALEGEPALSMDFSGTLTEVAFTPTAFCATVQPGPGGHLTLHRTPARDPALARLDGQPTGAALSGSTLTFAIPASATPTRLEVVF